MTDLLVKLYAVPRPRSPSSGDAATPGFACYDATARGMFGPMGIAESERNHGISSRLLVSALHDRAAQGYVYAMIGRSDSTEFYCKRAGATEIPDSDAGFYSGLIKQL